MFVNEILENIWKDRYQKNGETFDGNLRRVANYCGSTDKDKEDFYWVMKNRYFFPAGRTMSNSGIGENLTLNNCFLAGMKVLTDIGFENIEDIEIGSQVIAADDKWHKVVNTLERNYEGDIYKLSSSHFTGDIYCTPNHEFLTLNGWKSAENLTAKELVKIPNLRGDNDVVYVPVESIEVLDNQKCKVYNLSVEDEHSYTVNGVVVHNCFVAPQVQDDLSDIFAKVALGARTHQRGGGIGYCFSQLRPNGAPTSNDAVASGAVSFMDVFNAQTATILQGGRRK